jgi:hypothetical protein
MGARAPTVHLDGDGAPGAARPGQRDVDDVHPAQDLRRARYTGICSVSWYIPEYAVYPGIYRNMQCILVYTGLGGVSWLHQVSYTMHARYTATCGARVIPGIGYKRSHSLRPMYQARFTLYSAMSATRSPPRTRGAREMRRRNEAGRDRSACGVIHYAYVDNALPPRTCCGVGTILHVPPGFAG